MSSILHREHHKASSSKLHSNEETLKVQSEEHGNKEISQNQIQQQIGRSENNMFASKTDQETFPFITIPTQMI